MRLFYFSFYFSLTWVWLFTWVWFLTWAWLIYYLSQTNCKYPSRHVPRYLWFISYVHVWPFICKYFFFKNRLNSICILPAFLKTCNTVDFKWCQLFVAISCLCQYVHFISWKSVLRYVISNIDLSYTESDSTLLSESVVMVIILFTS